MQITDRRIATERSLAARAFELKRDLENPAYQSAVLSWASEAMVRGTLDGSIDKPEFIVALSGKSIPDRVVKVIPLIPSGRGYSRDYTNAIGVVASVGNYSAGSLAEPQTDSLTCTLLGPDVYDDALERAEKIIPAAQAAQPLPIDASLARLLLPVVTNDLYS